MSGSVQGKAIHFDDRYLHVELQDGRIISRPMDWYPELREATISQMKDYRLICRGTGIEWSGLDYHLSIESMLALRSDRSVA